MIKDRIISISLIILLIVSFTPMFPQSVDADVQMENGAQADSYLVNSDNRNGVTAYFGSYPQSEILSTTGLTEGKDYIKEDGKYFKIEPILWNVKRNAGGKLFLFSGKLIDGGKPFNDLHEEILWENSTIRNWLNSPAGFSGRAFTDNELNSITEMNNDKTFLLSIEEALDTTLGFENHINQDLNRKAEKTDYAAHYPVDEDFVSDDPDVNDNMWWLRSQGEFDGSQVAYVTGTGSVDSLGTSVNDDDLYYIRPALNLDIDSILFTSAASGVYAKPNKAGNSLTEVIPADAGVKFTVKDLSITSGGIKQTGYDAATGTVLFSYKGATAGKTLSAIMIDDTHDIKYYGKLATKINKDGNTGVILPEDFSSDDKLKIFVEECNGDYHTDYSSEPVELEVDTTSHMNTGIMITGAPTYYTWRASVNKPVQLGTTEINSKIIIKDINWSVNNTGIATINENGLLTFKGAEGKVRVTATSKSNQTVKAYKDISVVKNVTKIDSPMKTIYVKSGKSIAIPAVIYDGDNEIDTELGWKSSNSKIKVTKGSVKIPKALKKGKTTITAKAGNGNQMKVTINVSKKAVKLKKLTVTAPKTLSVGKTKKLSIRLKPSNSTLTKITFKSSDASGLYVDKAGKLTAMKTGTYRITVKVNNKTMKKTVKVT